MSKGLPDPFNSPRWSPAQALAWIMFGRPEAVREVSPGTRRQHYEEVRLPDGRVELALVPSPKVDMMTFTMMAVLDGTTARLDDAIAELGSRLGAGEVTATGRRSRVGPRIPMPTAEWSLLEFLLDEGSDDAGFERGEPRWYEVELDAGQVRQLWPHPFETLPPDPESLPPADAITLETLGRRWHGEQRPHITVEELVRSLVDFAKRGAFQATVPVSLRPMYQQRFGYDLRTSTLIDLFSRDDRPVAGYMVENILNASAERRATEMRLAADLRVSLAGIRRWCDADGSETWRKGHGLTRPRFIDPPQERKSRVAKPHSPAVLRAWYIEYVKRHNETDIAPGREDDWAAAKAEVGPGVPRDAVYALRRELAPETWRKHGRRPARPVKTAGGETADE